MNNGRQTIDISAAKRNFLAALLPSVSVCLPDIFSQIRMCLSFFSVPSQVRVTPRRTIAVCSFSERYHRARELPREEQKTSASHRSYNCTERCAQNLSSGARSAPGDNDPHENYGGIVSGRSRSRMNFHQMIFPLTLPNSCRALARTSAHGTALFDP